MSRYIDADALIFFGFDNPDDGNLFKFVPKEFIDNAPTADVVPMEFHDKCMQIESRKRRNMVEVVRCKDCQFHYQENGDPIWCNHFLYAITGDDYCSQGERIEYGEMH